MHVMRVIGFNSGLAGLLLDSHTRGIFVEKGRY